MMRKSYLLVMISLIIGLCSCHKDNKDDDDKVSPRTVLMYLVANNSIGDDVVAGISYVEQGLQKGNLPEGTFVIYCDGSSYFKDYSTPTLFKYTVDAKGKVSEREVICTYSEQNSCSKEVITKVLKDVKQLCPALSYGITFGSHATGWLPTDYKNKSRSFGDDSGAYVDIPGLAEAIDASGIHFDFLLMDACLMSQVEVAYELRGVADYLILSPAEVMSYGFPYNNIMDLLLSTGNKEENAVSIAKAFINFYKTYTYKWGTIAVVKTSMMDDLAAVTRDVTEINRDRLSIFTTAKLTTMASKWGYSRGSTLGYSSYDFLAYIRELTDNNVPSSFTEVLNKTVIYADYVNDYVIVNIDPDCYSGIGCYIPYESYTNWNDYYKTLDWYKVTNL